MGDAVWKMCRMCLIGDAEPPPPTTNQSTAESFGMFSGWININTGLGLEKKNSSDELPNAPYPHQASPY